MLYVVTGFPRSGTSAMMQCLKAGGIEPIYHPSREAQQQAKRPGANPHWYELWPEQMASASSVYYSVVDGMALKLPTMYLLNLPPRPCTLIWMHRDPAEIRRSYEKWYSDEEFQRQMPAKNWPADYYETTRVMREFMEDRKSVAAIIDVQFMELLADPVSQLSKIQGIDPVAASSPIQLRRAA